MKRRVISLLMLVVILLSQLSVVFAEEISDATTTSLIDYLVEYGLDEDKSGTISDAEWAKIKNLDLYEINDFTGIEKAINLKNLTLDSCTNIIGADFSKLETLTIENCDNISARDFNKLEELKSLKISNVDPAIFDFSKLTKLENLMFNNYSEININIDFSSIANATNLKKIDLYGDLNHSVSNIDFSKLQKLENLFIQNNGNETINLSNLSDAVNLLEVQISNNCDISNVEFSKLTKLESLSTECTPNFTKVNGTMNLKSLNISGNCDISAIDFSKLSKLEDLYISNLNENYSVLDFPKMNNLKHLNICYNWGRYFRGNKPFKFE